MSTTPPSPPPSDELPIGATAAVSAPAASAKMQESHEDRWSRWAIKNASREFISERRFQIIAGVIATGLIGWLVLTT